MAEANKLSDGFLPTWRICPYCGSDDTRAMISLVNAGYLAGMTLQCIALFVLTWVVGEAGDGSPLTFKRVCRKCRGRFWPNPTREPSLNCGQCGYDLTGNVSGVCPECGWQIPPNIMARPTAPRSHKTEKQS